MAAAPRRKLDVRVHARDDLEEEGQGGSVVVGPAQGLDHVVEEPIVVGTLAQVPNHVVHEMSCCIRGIMDH